MLLIVGPIVVLCVCCELLCVFSSFCYHFDGEERVGCLPLFVFLMSCDCYCSVALHNDAVGWSALCDCGIA